MKTFRQSYSFLNESQDQTELGKRLGLVHQGKGIYTNSAGDKFFYNEKSKLFVGWTGKLDPENKEHWDKNFKQSQTVKPVEKVETEKWVNPYPYDKEGKPKNGTNIYIKDKNGTTFHETLVGTEQYVIDAAIRNMENKIKWSKEGRSYSNIDYKTAEIYVNGEMVRPSENNSKVDDINLDDLEKELSDFKDDSALSFYSDIPTKAKPETTSETINNLLKNGGSVVLGLYNSSMTFKARHSGIFFNGKKTGNLYYKHGKNNIDIERSPVLLYDKNGKLLGQVENKHKKDIEDFKKPVGDTQVEPENETDSEEEFDYGSLNFTDFKKKFQEDELKTNPDNAEFNSMPERLKSVYLNKLLMKTWRREEFPLEFLNDFPQNDKEIQEIRKQISQNKK